LKNLESNLTITICTLNEESNIEDCLTSVNESEYREIIVIDGDSDDRTRDIALNFGAKVINAGRYGLAHQRKIAVESTKTKYIALLDADHRPTKNSLSTLIVELENQNYGGIEAQIKSLNNSTYWDYGMELNFNLTHNKPGLRNMIGTPCIYKTSILTETNFNPKILGPSDDTDLCYRLHKKGIILAVGTPMIYQVHRSSFKSFVKKWIWYGKGDAQFVHEHPNRFLSILKHQLFNYGIKKSILAMKAKEYKYVLFFVSCGLLRFYGMIYEFINIFRNLSNFDRIYKT
jgi:glycosyltransferase involved in cell wall biosynthesis